VFLRFWPRCDSKTARPEKSILKNTKNPALSSGALEN